MKKTTTKKMVCSKLPKMKEDLDFINYIFELDSFPIDTSRTQYKAITTDIFTLRKSIGNDYELLINDNLVYFYDYLDIFVKKLREKYKLPSMQKLTIKKIGKILDLVYVAIPSRKEEIESKY